MLNFDDILKKKLPAIGDAPVTGLEEVAPPDVSADQLPPIDPIHGDAPAADKYVSQLPVIASDGQPPVQATPAALPSIDTPGTMPASSPALPTIGEPVDPIEKELAAKTVEYKDNHVYKDKKWSKWDKAAAALEGWAKNGIFGAIGAVKNPHYFEDQKIAQRDAVLLPQIGTLTQIRDSNLGAATKKAGIQNIKDDNVARDVRNTDLRNAANTKAMSTKLKNFTDRIWKAQKYFDPAQASALDKKELAALNLKPEDVGTFDFRDPKTKTINGVTFQWDANNQAFTESGLPKDGSKEIVEYNVTDPDGIPHKFSVTADRAAGFLTSIKAAGMSIDAAAARQTNQQNFQAGENEKSRKESLRKWAIENGVTRAKFQADLAEKVTSGHMTQEQADAALADFPTQ